MKVCWLVFPWLIWGGAVLPAGAQLRVSSLGSHELFSFDPETGVVQPGGPLVAAGAGGLSLPHGILDRSSGLYVASFGTDEILRYDRLTGTFEGVFVSSTAGMDAPVYLALGPADGLMYVSSQGNDSVLRFAADSGAPADAMPFVAGGMLDGPSGFGWSPDASMLYVAGRYSGNVLVYDAGTGAPLTEGHVLAAGMGMGDTFGLAVHEESGDVFVATQGEVRRYSASGVLRGVLDIPGTPIGLESWGPEGRIYVAASDNLYVIDAADNTVVGPLLSGAAIRTLNFFHFSRLNDPAASPLGFARGVGGAEGGRLTMWFDLSKYATESRLTLQHSEDLTNWMDGASYVPNESGVSRSGGLGTELVGMQTNLGRVRITERAVEDMPDRPRRYYRWMVNDE